MSKVKPKVPSGHLVLLTAPNTKGECAVYVRYFLGKYVKRSTGVIIPADGWGEKRECVKPTVKNAPYLNSVLRDFKAEIDNKLMKFDGVEMGLTAPLASRLERPSDCICGRK